MLAMTVSVFIVLFKRLETVDGGHERAHVEPYCSVDAVSSPFRGAWSDLPLSRFRDEIGEQPGIAAGTLAGGRDATDSIGSRIGEVRPRGFVIAVVDDDFPVQCVGAAALWPRTSDRTRALNKVTRIG